MAKSRYVPNPKRTALKTYLNAPQARLRAEAASQIKKQIEAGTYQVSTKLWNGKQWAYFCPMCRTSRSLPASPKSGTFKQFVQIALTTLVLTLALWPWVGAKGLVFFVPIWAVFETFHRIWARAMVRCKVCGFDPYLYVVSRERAMAEFDDHWRAKLSERGVQWQEDGTILDEANSASDQVLHADADSASGLNSAMDSGSEAGDEFEKQSGLNSQRTAGSSSRASRDFRSPAPPA
jgi:hypothetical protein